MSAGCGCRYELKKTKNQIYFFCTTSHVVNKLDMDNPLLKTEYGTVRNTIPFSKIGVREMEEAVTEGMRVEDEIIRSIADNPDTPTFANTIAVESGELLSAATGVMYNIMSAATSDETDDLVQRMSPLLTEHNNRIMMSERLFRRVRYVYENEMEQQDPEQQMLLEDVYRSFVRNGALLDDERKKELAALRVELSSLCVAFDRNRLQDINAFEMHLTDRGLTTGLPQSALDAASMAARERGKEGWVFTLDSPSYVAFMTYADNRELRRRMYVAKATLCHSGNDNDNTGIAKRIVNLRLGIAKLLGYDTYADFVLEKRMASNVGNVTTLLEQLCQYYLPAAREDVRRVEALAREDMGGDFTLQPWDFTYYSHKLKKRLYDIDSEMLRPYLSLDNVRKGVFGLATTLYGITFRRNESIEVYHPDVEAYEVYDADGTYLAVLYADFFPRSNKQSGAWMTDFAPQYVDDKGVDHRPHVSIVMNLTKPTDKAPSLLTISEVETFLHEFGHALHGIFSMCRYQSLSGTNVYRDFVELPSQFMENYATETDFLGTFAFHYQTGEPIPAELVSRLRDSRRYCAGYSCVRQLGFATLDMALYTLGNPLEEDIAAFEHRCTSHLQLLPLVPGECMAVQFGHIMSGGYSAGYYSYKWAEVLDADAFEAFVEEGIFNRQTARRFRDTILSQGGKEHPMQLYRRFRGSEPTIRPLLHRDGIEPVGTKR